MSALALYPDDDSNDLSDLGLGSNNGDSDRNRENVSSKVWNVTTLTLRN